MAISSQALLRLPTRMAASRLTAPKTLQSCNDGGCWQRPREWYLLRGVQVAVEGIALGLQLVLRLPQLPLQAHLVCLTL